MSQSVGSLNADRTQRFDATADDDAIDLTGITSTERKVLVLLSLGKTSKEIGRDLGVSPRTVQAHRRNIAEKLGVTFRVPLEKRIAGAERVGKHKTSMLQDVEAGKVLETDALIGAVVELGVLTGTPTPYISAIYAAVKLLSNTLELERVRVAAQPIEPAAPAPAPARDWRSLQYSTPPPLLAAGGAD